MKITDEQLREWGTLDPGAKQMATELLAARELLREADEWLAIGVIRNFTRPLRDRIAKVLGA